MGKREGKRQRMNSEKTVWEKVQTLLVFEAIVLCWILFFFFSACAKDKARKVYLLAIITAD